MYWPSCIVWANLTPFSLQMKELQALIAEQTVALGDSKIELEAFLLDSELFEYRTNSTPEYLAALTRKHDLIYNATEAHFPNAMIESYDRGSVGKSDINTWPLSDF